MEEAVRGMKSVVKAFEKVKGRDSVVDVFDHSKPLRKNKQIGCCSFVELKPAFGCYFNCQYPCYLASFRNKPAWNTMKDPKKVLKILKKSMALAEGPLMYNMGEQADALLLLRMGGEGPKLFSDIIDVFQNPSINIQRNKLLLLTKDYQESMWFRDNWDNVVMSVSLNIPEITKEVELGAVDIKWRIHNLVRAKEKGMEYRVRIDPIFYKEDRLFPYHYIKLIDFMKKMDLSPSVFTLGSLRLKTWGYYHARKQKKWWIKHLTEETEWGRRYPEDIRIGLYRPIIQAIRKNFPDSDIAVCKETLAVWKALKDLGLDHKKARCNCTLQYVDLSKK